MYKNKVVLTEDNIIEIHVVGDQVVDSVVAMGDDVVRLASKLRKAGQPVLVIDNLLEMGQVPPDARRMVVQLGKTIDYDKLVLYGTNAALRIGANLMLRAIGRGSTTRYFDNYEAAVAWLKA